VVAALSNRAVLTNALVGLAYSYGFFTILAYSPLTLRDLSPMALGVTYFFWGALLAIASVVVVNRLAGRFGEVPVLLADLGVMAVLLVAAGLVRGDALLYVIVLSGLFCGVANALFTTLAIEVSPFSRSISSGSYNFLRWGGAAVAPVLSGFVSDHYGPHVPFFIAAAIVLLGALGLWRRSAFVTDRLTASRSVVAD